MSIFGKKKVNGYEVYGDDKPSGEGLKGVVSQTGRGLGVIYNKAKTKLNDPSTKESGKKFLNGLQGMGDAYGKVLFDKPKRGKKGKNDDFGGFF